MLLATIAAVAVNLEDTRDPCCIISRTAATIQGAYPIAIGDFNVLLNPTHAAMLFAIGYSPAASSRHPRFRSDLFGRWAATPLTVEFMAGFRLRDRDGVWREVQPQTRVTVRVGGATVFTPSLHELRDMFERFGRERDRARVDLIDRLL